MPQFIEDQTTRVKHLRLLYVFLSETLRKGFDNRKIIEKDWFLIENHKQIKFTSARWIK